MTLRTAALYGRDPGDLRTSAEMLALRGVHPDVEAAEAALSSVRDKGPPDRPTHRRSWRTWVHSVYLLLIFGGFMSPSVAKEDTGTLGKLRAVFGVLLGVGIWVTTWVLPLTFMIVMAWGCETHARQLGRRTLLYYDGEAAEPPGGDQARRSAKRPRPRQTGDRAERRPVPLRRHPYRLRRLCAAHTPHRRVQLARCARCARRALAGDRNRRHLQPKVGAWELVARPQPTSATTGRGAPGALCRPLRGSPSVYAGGPRPLARAGDPGERRGEGRRGRSPAEPLAPRVRSARVRDRRVRDVVHRSQAARVQPGG